MSDLINRKKALDEISKIDTSIIPSGWVKGYVDETIKETQRIIRTIPSAKPERKKGEWLLKPNIYGVAYCSGCDYELHTNNTNFCPNCGADMRGEEDEHTD